MKYLKYFEETITGKVMSKELDKVFSDCKQFISDLKECDKGQFLVRGIGKNSDDMDFGIKLIEHNLSYRTPRDMPQDVHDLLNYRFENVFGWKVRNGIFSFGRKLELDYVKDQYEKQLKEYKENNKPTDKLSLDKMIYNSVSTGYGKKTFFVFPVGDYEIVWSRDINDLFSELETDLEPNEYDAKRKWEEEYGEEADGQWRYYGRSTDETHREDATEYIVRNWEQYTDYDIEDYEDEEELKDEIYDEVYSDLEWEPYVDWCDFWENYVDFYDFDININNIVDEYREGDLPRAINSQNEICIKADEYYVVDINMFAEELMKRIWE